jgi:DNA repair photolyase
MRREDISVSIKQRTFLNQCDTPEPPSAGEHDHEGRYRTEPETSSAETGIEGMDRSLPILRGRGAAADPANRFEALAVELDPEEAAAEPDRRETRYFRDPSRSVLTRNHSPDVGFDWSLNPYRGCEHGCVYCLVPETPVLYADLSERPLGEVAVGDVLLGFDEYPQPGRDRKLRPSVVEAVWRSRKPTIRVITDRAEVVTTAEHRWLLAQGRWVSTTGLSPGRTLRHLPVTSDETVDDDYRVGYITGISLGDATFRFEPNWRSDKLGFPAAYWRLALVDEQPLNRVVRYLRHHKVETRIRPFSPGTRGRRRMCKVETRALGHLARIHAILNRELQSSSYRRGFLAGFFDAEGHHGNSLRIFQKDRRILERIVRYGRTLGFDFYVEPQRPNGVSSLCLRGSVQDRMRFFAICRPAITRKRDEHFRRRPPTDPQPIRAIENGSSEDVVDIQTSTGTFYAAGLATHNCYARPTHEYLGFSAGLDFESRILVKEEAPELLRKGLSSRRWKPTPLVLSGVTDPYQPVERKLGITRRCLEVLEECRHPVAIVTKSRLVTRDLDLLASLARRDCAHVTVSVTTLDRRLQRTLEPRASPPEHRLDAIRALSEAGVPVAVNVAPIIPGLTDQEIPAILEAAARAGAVTAGRVLLRLPWGVKELFEEWLRSHVPDRAEKVLNRIRDTRGGKLYDAAFGDRMRGEGVFARQIQDLFEVSARRAGLERRRLSLSVDAFRRPDPDEAGPQLRLSL